MNVPLLALRPFRLFLRSAQFSVCLGCLFTPFAGADAQSPVSAISVRAENKEGALSFGISPEHPDSVQQGIENAYRSGAKKIVLPRGVYRIPRPENIPFHLRFADMKDFEIDATGVTFVFMGRDRRSILFENCERVTLRGLTMVREVPPFSQGKIEAVADDRRSVDIRVDRGYPADLDDKRYFTRVPVFNLYEKESRKLKPLVPDIYIASIERLGNDLFRFHCRSAIDARVPVAIGDPAAWRKGSGGEVAVWSSAGMRIENVTIKGSCGIAFMELCGEGGNHYINCRITYGAKPDGATDLPLLSSSEDGFHSASMRKGPVLEHCQFEGMDDDAVNIHGTYAMLVETGEKSAIIDWRTPHSGGADAVALCRSR